MVDIHQILKEREFLLYPHIPLGVLRNSGEWPQPLYQYSLFLYTNDNSDRIIEWICYNQSIGFNHFYIYSYHDNPKEFYEKISIFLNSADPIITYHHYPKPGDLHWAFCHFLHYYSHETQWILSINLDEFLCLKQQNNINNFIQNNFIDMDAIYFNTCIYGDNGHQYTPDGDILLNYTYRSNNVSPTTRVLIKSRSIPYHKFFIDRNYDFQSDYLQLNPNLVICNVLQQDLHSYFIDYPMSAMTYLQNDDRNIEILNIAYIAHFGLPCTDFIDQQKNNELFYFHCGEGYLFSFTNDQEYKDYFNSLNKIEDLSLYQLWIETLVQSWETSVFPVNFWPLISQNKPAKQSSTQHICTIEEDAQKLLNGNLTGRAQNMTQIENNPWWEIDLQAKYQIHEIQIFNRLDQNIKDACHFELWSSNDQENWICIEERNSSFAYGGMDGKPHTWTSEDGIIGQFVKLIIPDDHKQIALDQIQIFGEIIETNSI